MKLKRINHIALVVPQLKTAKKFWVDVMGLSLDHEAHIAEQQVDVAFMPIENSNIELLQPTDLTSGVAKFLNKRGAGMHHICFEIDDIDAAIEELQAAEVPLINETPQLDAHGKKLIFIHPKGTGGVLVELYELPQ